MKSLFSNARQKVLIIACILITFSCQQSDSDLQPDIISQEVLIKFGQDMENLSEFEQPAELSEPEKISEEEKERDTEDTSLECFSTYYKAAPGFDEMLALDPTSDVIYPGALIQGASIPTGEYIPIVADRDSLTLSISLQNLAGSPVVKVGNPKLSTVRAGVKTILDKEVTGATPAKINYEITQVYSKEQLNLAIGANYRSAATKVSSSFDFSSKNYSNRFVLKFLQVYYTIDMDTPSTPGELFTKLPDLESLGSTSPVYVSTVTYGRMIIYTIETNYSSTEINAAFEASFAGNSGSVDTKYKEVFTSSSIKALVIGGSGESASNTVSSPSDVYDYISTGGNYSRDSPGAALSYKLRYLKNNAVARLVLSSEYFVRSCDLAWPKFSIELKSIECVSCQDGNGSAGEVYGRIWGYVRVSGKEVAPRVDWNHSKESQYVSIKKGKSKTIGLSKIVELYRPDYDVDHVLMGGRMRESDASPDKDDNFGDISPGQTKLLKEIKYGDTPHTLDFGEVKVHFNLRRLK